VGTSPVSSLCVTPVEYTLWSVSHDAGPADLGGHVRQAFIQDSAASVAFDEPRRQGEFDEHGISRETVGARRLVAPATQVLQPQKDRRVALDPSSPSAALAPRLIGRSRAAVYSVDRGED